MDEATSPSKEPPTDHEKRQPQPEDDPHGVPIIQNSEFQSADGFNICCKSWSPETRPRGLVFMVHTYTEHCHQPHYDTLAKALVALGCCVFAQDLVGHGKSSGPRAFVKSIDTYVDDVLHQADVTRRRFPRKPVYLFGYSMGGLISVIAAQRRPLDFAGIVLMSPLIAFARKRATWFKKTSAKVLGNVAPSAPVASVNVQFISRDPEVVIAAINDPLRYHGSVPAGWASAMLKAMQEALDKAGNLELPLLVLVGSDDQIGDPKVTKAFFQKTTSKDKTIKVYEGAYHNLLTEPGGIKEQVLKDITDWFVASLPSRRFSVVCPSPRRKSEDHTAATANRIEY
ncbi:monoglyceride lipase-like [Haemaphysalis longicornis]